MLNAVRNIVHCQSQEKVSMKNFAIILLGMAISLGYSSLT
jgi:hypothetical protein